MSLQTYSALSATIGTVKSAWFEPNMFTDFFPQKQNNLTLG